MNLHESFLIMYSICIDIAFCFSSIHTQNTRFTTPISYRNAPIDPAPIRLQIQSRNFLFMYFLNIWFHLCPAKANRKNRVKQPYDTIRPFSTL